MVEEEILCRHLNHIRTSCIIKSTFTSPLTISIDSVSWTTITLAAKYEQ